MTRNLLYHYFPRGRRDVIVAVVERAGMELSSDWVVDDSLPLSQRLTANFARMLGHALGPSEPPPLVHLALTGFLALAEAALDEARIMNIPPEDVMRLLSETLVATIDAATTA